MFFKESFF